MKLCRQMMFVVVIACTFVQSVYSMESNTELTEKFNTVSTDILFQTYKQLSFVPHHVVQDIAEQTHSMWIGEKSTVYLDENLNKYIVLKPNTAFLDEEYSKRYPWKINERRLSDSVLYSPYKKKALAMQDISRLSFSLQREGYKVVGPNNNKRAIINDQVVNINEVQQEAEQKANDSFFVFLKKKVTTQKASFDPITVPGEAIAIHPNENICALIKGSGGGLAIYNLDDTSQVDLNNSGDVMWNQDFPVIADFSHDGRLFVVYKGVLRIYSVVDRALQKTVDFTECITDKDYERLEVERKPLVDSTPSTDGVRYKACVQDFDYCSKYDPFILCRLKFEYFMCDNQGTTVVQTITPQLTPLSIPRSYYVLYNMASDTCTLLDTEQSTFDTWFWDSSISLYRLRSYTDWHVNQSIQRNTVSFFSWNAEDVRDYILASAAYNWLQGSRDKRDKVEGEKILDCLKQPILNSENNVVLDNQGNEKFFRNYKLLWRTQYVKEDGTISNVFKDIFTALRV